MDCMSLHEDIPTWAWWLIGLAVFLIIWLILWLL